MKMPAYPFSAL